VALLRGGYYFGIRRSITSLRLRKEGVHGGSKYPKTGEAAPPFVKIRSIRGKKIQTSLTPPFSPSLHPPSVHTVSFMFRPLFLSLLLSVVAHGAQPDFMGTRIDRDFEIKGLSIPLHDTANGFEPLRITCARVGLESKKVGLFRIGPMPQLVIEDMAILLLQNVDLAASAAALDAFFNANPTWSDITIRGFEVRQMPSQTVLLKADSARIDASQGKILFEKSLVQQTIGDKVTAPRAVLRLRGNLAGQVFRIRGRSDDSLKIYP